MQQTVDNIDKANRPYGALEWRLVPLLARATMPNARPTLRSGSTAASCSVTIGRHYTAPAKLFAAQERNGLRYRRFLHAAEAIRYAVEKLPPDARASARLEVQDKCYDANQIRSLYENAPTRRIWHLAVNCSPITSGQPSPPFWVRDECFRYAERGSSTRRISTAGGARRISLKACIQSAVLFLEPTPR
jgi:hypothetical protein